MPHYEVTLHTEQEATVVVYLDGDLPAERDARDAVLREAALAKLDESGGAEWETTNAWESSIALAPDEV